MLEERCWFLAAISSKSQKEDPSLQKACTETTPVQAEKVKAVDEKAITLFWRSRMKGITIAATRPIMDVDPTPFSDRKKNRCK